MPRARDPLPGRPVSNFEPAHLQRLIDHGGFMPAVNQVELHHGIATEAWSPPAQGAVLKDPAITGIANRTGKSPAQVVLRRHLQLGNVVIPTSATSARTRTSSTDPWSGPAGRAAQSPLSTSMSSGVVTHSTPPPTGRTYTSVTGPQPGSLLRLES